MVNKLISSVMFTSSFVIMAIGNSDPNNLLFAFISSNKLVALSRIGLTLGLILLSFKGYISELKLRRTAHYVGLGLIIAGLLAIAYTSLGSAIYDYMKLLDILIVMEAGIILTSCALATPQTTTKTVRQKKMVPALRHSAA